MHTVLRILVGVALSALSLLAYADPPGRVARLNYIAGQVSLALGEAPDQWVQAVLNRPLTGGDRIWADRDGRGEFHVGSTAVRVAPLTNVDVLHLDDDRLQLRLGQGTMNVRVRDLDADDLVEIATAAGAILVRQPGSYRVSADPQSGTVRVVVNFGQAELVTPVQSFVVPSSQSAIIDIGGQPTFEVATSAAPGEFDRWSTERDRREDRVAATRYVSPHMTGYEDLDQHGTWQTLPEYGAVWVPARVTAGWAPYRQGHWAWVSPWGWTWVDDAPWGFAPYHYGRWVHVRDYWAWAPGPIVRRPIYAPALVGFVGGSGWAVSARSGPAVGWFPLGWREPYRPWYRASPAYVRNVNVTHVTNVNNVTNVTNVYRNRTDAVTVVPQQAFVSARPVAQARVNVAQFELAKAEVIQDKPPAQPVRASITPERQGSRPPPQAASREVVAVTAPSSSAVRELPGQREGGSAGATGRSDTEPRVRVIERERGESRRTERARERESSQERSIATTPSTPAALPSTPAAIPQSATIAPRTPGVTAQPGGSSPSAPAAAAAPQAVAAPPAAARPSVQAAEQPGSARLSTPAAQATQAASAKQRQSGTPPLAAPSSAPAPLALPGDAAASRSAPPVSSAAPARADPAAAAANERPPRAVESAEAARLRSEAARERVDAQRQRVDATRERGEGRRDDQDGSRERRREAQSGEGSGDRSLARDRGTARLENQAGREPNAQRPAAPAVAPAAPAIAPAAPAAQAVRENAPRQAPLQREAAAPKAAQPAPAAAAAPAPQAGPPQRQQQREGARPGGAPPS